MSGIEKAISWFKERWIAEMSLATEGTPFSVDLLCAIAYQETGYIWNPLIGKVAEEVMLRVCVGDTIDYPSRTAFPRTKANLLSVDQGPEMFGVARSALLNVAKYNKGYAKEAKKKNEFCHGFGIFQYDLQFFLTDPDYFLEERWTNFSSCLAKFIGELYAAKRRQGWKDKTTLTDREQVFVAIAYNMGKATLSKGFKQGHKSGGRYYGENIDRNLRLAKGIMVGNLPTPGTGITGDLYAVAVSSRLNLRKTPSASAQVLAKLPPGQIVQRLFGMDGDRWWNIEARMAGTPVRGYVAARYLKRVSEAVVVEEVPPSPDFSATSEADTPTFLRDELFLGGSVKKGMKNKRVAIVQEWLCHHGFRTGIDGDFGGATLEQLNRFQKKHQLAVESVVTDPTWEALVAPMKAALSKPTGVSGMTLAEVVAAVAEQHVREHPVEIGGANRGPWVRLYCHGNDGSEWAWCAGFVSLLMHQACHYLERDAPIKGSVSCDVLATQAKAAKLFVDGTDIVSGEVTWKDFGGCCIFLRRRTSTDWTHTGIALKAKGKMKALVFDTIEGNTNDEGSREGFEACRRTRSVAGRNYDFISFEAI